MTRRSTPQRKIDATAFPIVVRVLVPETGFSSFGRENHLWQWLDREIGIGNYAETGHTSVFGDATAFNFRTVQGAVAFLDRFPMLVLADDTMGSVYRSPHAPFGRGETDTVCNLYSMTRTQDTIRQLFAPLPLLDRLGNLPPAPEIYSDQSAPIVRTGPEGRELVMARWGMPTPPQYLIGKRTDRGVTNIRNTASPHWRRWLGPESRCLVPFTRFSESAAGEPGHVAWFTLADDRPAFFAGLWTRWTSVRKLKDGESTDDLFAFLTTTPNAEVAPIHPKAMPVVLTDPNDWATWLVSDWNDARGLQRPLANGVLRLA